MNNNVLNMILHRLDKIDDTLHSLQDEFATKHGELTTKYGELVAKQDEFAAKQDEFAAKQDEMLSEQKSMRKDIIGLRDDVDTIYIIQQESNKTLQRHEAILNVHTDKLNTLIALSEENKEDHIEFDKRISRLETLIS